MINIVQTGAKVSTVNVSGGLMATEREIPEIRNSGRQKPSKKGSAASPKHRKARHGAQKIWQRMGRTKGLKYHPKQALAS